MTAFKPRLAALIHILSAGLVERATPVRLALLAALASEHILLVGAPGTAKSELARRLHRAFRDAAYFERLLTRFSVPEELFGPLSIAALEQDRYERQTDGYLPSASIAFIDEVFKANSAILNALLTLLNEREFDNGASRVKTPLISVVGATNEVPDDEVGAAFYDRFLVRCQLEPVSAPGFEELLRLPEADFGSPDPAAKLGRDDLAAIDAGVGSVTLPQEVTELLAAMREFLSGQGIYVSDRRWRKLVRLLKTAALTDGRDAVSVWDLWLAQFCAIQRLDQRPLVEQWFAARVGTDRVHNPERFTRAVEAFEAQLELERSSEELNYDASGRLAVAGVNDGKGGEPAPRMTYFGKYRRYGRTHVNARVNQVQEMMDQANGFLARLDAVLEDLGRISRDHLWIDPAFFEKARANLLGTRATAETLALRLAGTREGFRALPLLEADPGQRPDPVVLD